MQDALPPSIISETQFPKVFAWMNRFKAELKRVKTSGFKPVTLKGDAVIKYMQTARFVEAAGEVDANDPTGLQAGDEVDIWPFDSGFSHKDRGKLVTLTPGEMVVAKKTKVGDREIRIHMQRWGFRIAKVKAAGSRL
jgi:hypothetical protein